jgi:hypothetical protein
MLIPKKTLLILYSILLTVLYYSTRPPRNIEWLNWYSRKDFRARRAGKSLYILTNDLPPVRRTALFVGFCGRCPSAMLSRIANFKVASKPSSVNKEIISH